MLKISFTKLFELVFNICYNKFDSTKGELFMNDFALCTDIEIVMELLDITAKELADDIGVTATTISRWRKNEEQISSSNLNAFCCCCCWLCVNNGGTGD